MTKTGAITAEEAGSTLLDTHRVCRGPCFDCSYFLEVLVDMSLLSSFMSMYRRNAPSSHFLEFNTFSCTLPRQGMRRGRLVRNNNFSFLCISITSLRHILFWFLLFLQSVSVRSGWFDVAQLFPQSVTAFVLSSYFFYQDSCTGTSLHAEKVEWSHWTIIKGTKRCLFSAVNGSQWLVVITKVLLWDSPLMHQVCTCIFHTFINFKMCLEWTTRYSVCYYNSKSI